MWTTAANHERITLTVVGPDGTAYRKEFASGSAPSFRLQDLGAKVSDGSYRYEMRFAPNVSSEVKRQLAAARAANDEVAAARIQREAGLTEELVMSGSLSVLNGAFVSPDAIEPPSPGNQPATASTGGTTSASSINSPRTITPLDVVHADDVIIQGSLCVGLDCVNNESFGFDTIRLKENNTRIKFEDTSTGSFPTTDWQLTANDSASGAASKFSIEDITSSKVPFTVTGGAATNSIFVDSTGRVGFRTSTPVLDLHVSTSNTPALRLEQTSAGGFTAQTWDVAGNEANFFVRDVTGGSRLSFRIRPGAPTSSIDIASDGDVGIGTASPGAKLDIGTGSAARGAFTKLLIGSGADTSQLEFFGTTKSAAISYNGTLLSVFTNGSSFVQALNIDNSGNVGINNAAPSSKLHVNGDIRITGGSFIDDGVTLTAPDYVFENNYKLMPLNQLSDFIRSEKHLPNVPSAKEVKSNGLNLSQFQMRLLEKVEELTLYTLDQHEQIGSLKTQNQQLLDRLATLEKRVGEQKQ